MTSVGRSDRAKFQGELEHLMNVLTVEYGTKNFLSQEEVGQAGTLVLEGWADQTATLTWDDDLKWSIQVTRNGSTRESKEGTFPEKDFWYAVVSAAHIINIRPSMKVERPNKALDIILKSAAIAALLIALKVGAVSFANKAPVAQGLTTAQELFASFGFDGWLNVTLGTALNTPVVSLLFLAVSFYWIYRRTASDFRFSTDKASTRVMFSLFMWALPLAFAILIAEWADRILIVVAAGVILWADSLFSDKPRRLRQWRKSGSRVENSPDLIALACYYEWPDEFRTTLDQMGSRLARDSEHLEATLFRERDDVYSNKEFGDLYARTEALNFVLRQEVLRLQRGRVQSMEQMLWRRRVMTKVRDFGMGLAQTPIYWFITPVLAGLLIIDVRPWMPPLCFEDQGNRMTVYEVQGVPPRYLIDSTRAILYSSFTGTEKLTQGECQIPPP
ncbi:hypothetical protein ACS5PJ_22380 [Pseudarthrobacter sp. YS3]|uniref:hypothetical protein n=1 Tax=Pseudarthrobacter sp. YS3 TaxID=3453718 RepID=UPI003EEBFD3E